MVPCGVHTAGNHFCAVRAVDVDFSGGADTYKPTIPPVDRVCEPDRQEGFLRIFEEIVKISRKAVAKRGT